MPRVNVYLPEDLAEKAKRADLNVSALAQAAIRQALSAHETTAWLATLNTGSASAVSHESTLESLDAERNEAVTRHA